jgi:hypothetical protein
MLAVHSRWLVQSAIHRCATGRLSAVCRPHPFQTVERERVMGVNTDYLGHVEIVPNLCTSEDQR